MSDRIGLRPFVLSVVWLAGTGGAGCSRSRPAAKAVDTTPAVVGTLREGYTGRPIGAGELVLGDDDARLHFTVFASAKPDAAGHFRFDRVPPLEHLQLQWKPDAAANALLGLKLSENFNEHVMKAPGHFDPDDIVNMKKAAGKPLDLGEVSVWLDALGNEAFGGVCATGRPASGAPAATPAVFLVQDEPGQPFSLSSPRQPELIGLWPAAWKGVVCIAETHTEMGRYGISGTAYRTTWRVRVVRLPDGRTFSTTVKGDPPRSISVNASTSIPTSGSFDYKGDPGPRLQEWLAALAQGKD